MNRGIQTVEFMMVWLLGILFILAAMTALENARDAALLKRENLILIAALSKRADYGRAKIEDEQRAVDKSLENSRLPI